MYEGRVISREIRPLAVLYPLTLIKNALNRAAILSIAGGGMLMPTSFAPFSIALV